MNNIFELIINNDLSIIPEVASFISNSAIKLGLSKRKAYYLCFTIETALELRMKALNSNSDTIKLIASDNGSYFKYSIIDYGNPYILTKNQQTILKRKLVDKYSFEQNGRKGQCFSFIYKYDVIKQEKTINPIKEELLDTELTYRRLKTNDEDILNAINCLYDTYGYEYYHQNLYSVEAFKKYIKNGRYVPIIGQNKHNQVLCYCALDENTWFEGVPELANLVTKPIARGCGLASNIFKQTEEIAKSMNYEGVHVSAVAYHPYTQKMCNKFNYTPSAIEYSINPIGTGGSKENRRLDCVIGIKIFNKDKKHDLYIDKECNDMFNLIFKNESLNYEIHNDEITYANENILTYAIDTDTSNCFMKIDECSKDIKDELNKITNSDEIKECDVVTVNLNINNPSSINGYKALRDLGFICVGTIPGSKNGDYMLLQSFKIKPEYEKIVLEDNYKELLKEVYKLNNI